MSFNRFLELFTNLLSIAIEYKRIFFIWFFIYIFGLGLIYLYKINNYQYDLEIRIMQQYTPMERVFPRGTDPFAYKLIKQDLGRYGVYWINNPEERYVELLFKIVKNSKEEVAKIIDEINLEVEKYKVEVIKLATKHNYELDVELSRIMKEGTPGRSAYYEYYFQQRFVNKLFLSRYTNHFIQNNYKSENINNANVNVIIQHFSVYVLVLYLLNLLFLIYLKYYKEKRFS